MASVEQKNATGNTNGNNGTIKPNINAVAEPTEPPKDAKDLLPHLESLERIIKLPVVNAAWDKSQDVYGKVKGKNRVFNWALNAAEDCVARAVTTAAPIVNRLDRPIAYVDQTLVKGIETLEVKAPIIKDTPQEIYAQAKNKVIDVVQPHLERVVKFKAAGQQKAASLKDLAWQKANEVLATQYGSLAVNGVDTTTALAERLLEYYFPKSESDIEEDNDKQKAVVRNGKSAENDINVIGEPDYDQEIDTRFLIAASTVFLSMSLKIITEIVEYIRRNPEIVGIIDREINNLMCQFPPARTPYYTQSRPSAAYPIRSRVASIEMSPDRSNRSSKATSTTI
ncbi:lipid storage droplets surface-binding protein 2 isoform X3 [Drosophila mojavensis]|uniref:Lipid storage droplets surface-binding protein 2 isoform X3 n=1 Tax=Drosophila arizonae TaxID=7263 RepID=A0ABM1PUU9_DROAR|nr:PREDICTED: lipid storage droplets surface-binding protein 2 isoform X3 [Drosophila arizonae]XP_043865469.1 lipid storage droplets surface-binding protein 2 isoform X3 [Drosophila mojavensis]